MPKINREENNMEEKFIKLQLFGDPSGDPNANAKDPSGSGDPGAGGDDATPNAAQELIEFKKKFVSREQYEAEKQRADEIGRAHV